MAPLEHVLSIGWLLRPAPTAVSNGRSRAAAAADDDDDEVEELSEETFKRQTLRVVRTDVGVRTVGGRVGLFAYAELPKCRFVGFYYGTWLSEAEYLALLEQEAQEPRSRPFGKYALRSSPMQVSGGTAHLVCIPEIAKNAVAPDSDGRSKLFRTNRAGDGQTANCILAELILSRDQLDGTPPRGFGPYVAFVLLTTRNIAFGEELVWTTGQTYRAGVPSRGLCYGWDIKSAFPGGVPAHVVGDAALATTPAPPAGAGSSSSEDLYLGLIRRGVEVQTITKNGVRMKGLFTGERLPACTLVGFFLGDWYSDATYAELLEAEQDEPLPRPFETYAIRSGEEEIDGRMVHLICAPTIAKGQTQPDPDRSKLFFANEPDEGRRANCQLCELVLEEDDLDGPPPNTTNGPFVAFVLVTTDVVERNFELTWSYGQSYAPNRQGYRAGAPAAANCDDFDVRDVYPDGVPSTAVSNYVPAEVDSSQSSGDDPEFVGAAFSQCVI
jgi:hypothetical protein